MSTPHTEGSLKGQISEISFHAGLHRVQAFYNKLGAPQLAARKGLPRHPVWRVWDLQHNTVPMRVSFRFCGHDFYMPLHSGMLLMLPGVAGYPQERLGHPLGLIISRADIGTTFVGGRSALHRDCPFTLFGEDGSVLGERTLRSFVPTNENSLLWAYNMPR